MTGLDVEAVLRDHAFVPSYRGSESGRCAACHPPELRDMMGANVHRAHVAAVLRVEIESVLADAWDAGHKAGEQDIDAAYWGERFTDTLNPYRPTLAATEGDRQ